MSKAEYDSLNETAYLLRNAPNADRLLSAIDRAKRGEFEQHVLAGAGSRRIDSANRLVYYVTDEHIVILQARDHY